MSPANGPSPPTALDKVTDMADAVSTINDGDVVMVGGFGVPGTPFMLIEQLVAHGVGDLTLVKNDANEAAMGIDKLLSNGQVSRLITSHIGLNRNAVALKEAGALAVELCPQGILAERIRAGGAGLLGLVTDVGIGTVFGEGKPSVEIDGVAGVLETALRADVALIHAHRCDRFGNLTYDATARNFNPLMAMAADHVIVETEQLVEIGSMDPNHVHTPGPFVDAVVETGPLPEVYGVVER